MVRRHSVPLVTVVITSWELVPVVGAEPSNNSWAEAGAIKCDECGGKLKAKRMMGDLLMLICPDCWSDWPVYASQKGGKWKRKR